MAGKCLMQLNPYCLMCIYIFISIIIIMKDYKNMSYVNNFLQATAVSSEGSFGKHKSYLNRTNFMII